MENIKTIKSAVKYVADLYGVYPNQVRDNVLNVYVNNAHELFMINNDCECGGAEKCLYCRPSFNLNYHRKPHDVDKCKPCQILRKVFNAQRLLLKEFSHLMTFTPPMDEWVEDWSFANQRAYSCLFGGIPRTSYPNLALVKNVAYV